MTRKRGSRGTVSAIRRGLLGASRQPRACFPRLLAGVTAAITALAVTLFGRPTAAQQPERDSLRAGSEAYQVADFERAVPLLSYGLNPEADLPDTLWVGALHKLAHALIETGRVPLATVWLRWALRQRAPIQVDDANFPPALLSSFAEAATSLQLSRGDDSLVTTRWEWPPGPVSQLTLGALRVSTDMDSFPGLAVRLAVTLTVAGRLRLGGLALGQPRHLAPGTYTVTVSGPEFRDVSVEREILPGVLTDIAFRLPRRPVLLYLTSDPEALFYVDGQLVGFTAPSEPDCNTHVPRCGNPTCVGLCIEPAAAPNHSQAGRLHSLRHDDRIGRWPCEIERQAPEGESPVNSRDSEVAFMPWPRVRIAVTAMIAPRPWKGNGW